jgi:glycosyltransferase involved in cell wall biosynthesis
MKIAFITTMEHAPWGGSEELWSEAALRLLQDKVTVAARVRAWPQAVGEVERLERAGCQLERQPPVGRRERVLRKVNPRRPFQWLDDFRPDLVVISLTHQIVGVEWMKGCLDRNLPYALVVQAAGECWWPDDDFLRPLRDGFEGAKACFFVSQHNLDFVRQQLGTPLDRGRVVRNPFKVPYLPQLSWPPTEPNFKLACVGRLEPFGKGQDVLFQVLSSEKWRSRSLKVSLFGNGGNRDTLEKLKAFRHLDNVCFRGFVPDIEAIWAEHHALVLPSRVEGLPIAMVEAMLCARPCIVTAVGGSNEIVEDDLSGFIALAPTPQLLDYAMERAWERRSSWREMGETAAERARQLVPSDPAQVFADQLKCLV